MPIKNIQHNYDSIKHNTVQSDSKKQSFGSNYKK